MKIYNAVGYACLLLYAVLARISRRRISVRGWG